MTENTCGECETFDECALRHKALSMVLSNDKPACADFERADSLEQVAFDMLALIRTARLHPLALDPNKGAGGQIVYSLPEQVFADRLRALGVEVSQ